MSISRLSVPVGQPAFMTGIGFLSYPIAWIIMPEEPRLLPAPAGTPQAIVNRIQQEVARVVKLPEIRERLDQMSIVPSGNTPGEFRAIIARDIAKWTAVAKAANIKAD